MKRIDKFTTILWVIIIAGFLVLMVVNEHKGNIEYVVHYGVLALIIEISLFARLIATKLDNLESKVNEKKEGADTSSFGSGYNALGEFEEKNLLTNFNKNELPIYQKAIKEYGDRSLFISKRAFDRWGNDLSENLMSLRITQCKELSKFWEIFNRIRKETGNNVMSKTVCECKDGYCNFQPVFEDKQETKFKYYQCTECGYIMTDDDIKRQLVMCSLHGDFCKFIDKTIAYYKDGNNSQYNDGFIIGSIITVKELGIIDSEQADELIKKTKIDVDFYSKEDKD